MTSSQKDYSHSYYGGGVARQNSIESLGSCSNVMREDQIKKILDLTPHSYDSLFKRIQSSIRPLQDLSSDEEDLEKRGCFDVRASPIILKDPDEDDVEQQQQQIKRPFLRRGSGLMRFHMTKDDFKRPPEIYNKPEIKSSLKKGQLRSTKSLPPQKSRVEKIPPKRAPRVNRSFDDEIIPTHRDKVIAPNALTGGNAPKGILISRPSQRMLDVPKVPMRKLTLKVAKDATKAREDKENMIFEKLEQRVTEDNFSVNNASVQYLLNGTLTSTPKKAKNLTENGNCYNEPKNTENGPEKQLDEDTHYQNHARESDDNQLSDNEAVQIITRPKLPSEQEIVKRKGLQDNVKKLFECNVNFKKKPTYRIVKKVKIKKPKIVEKEKFTIHELKSRLEELEREKTTFQVENNKLKRAQKEIFDEKVKLEKMRRDDEKAIKEEKARLIEERVKLQEDLKKLQREKQVFDTFCRETKQLATREEREEIRSLKKEIESLKELLNTKEARWGSSQARLRNQIKTSEGEIARLKSELETAKKSATKKVSFEDPQAISTKMIHVINRELDRRLNSDASRPVSARSSTTVKVPALKRSKSASDLKVKTKPIRGRTMSSVETKKDVENAPDVEIIDLIGDVNRDTLDRRDEIETSESPEIEEIETNISRVDISADAKPNGGMRHSHSADSGLGSEAAISSNDAHRRKEWRDKSPCSGSCECLETDCFSKTPSTYSAILDLKQRVGGLAGAKGNEKTAQSSRQSSHSSGINFDQARQHNPVSSHIQSTMEPRNITQGDITRTFYPNGDIKERNVRNGSEKYLYRDSGVWQTTYQDRPGYQKLDMPDGRTVVYHPDGNMDTLYPNGNTVRLEPNGCEEWRFKTGEIVRTDSNGDKILIFPDGRRETTTKEYSRMEYPDGTMKTVDKNGRQQTRYPNGQIRMRDRHGNLLMNTVGFP